MSITKADNQIQREHALEALARLKERISSRTKEFVTTRLDSRTVVLARPDQIKGIIKRIKANTI